MDRRPGFLRPSAPEVAVFVSGVSSMGLEILAGRMIAPQFGSSIYTWGSIIGVFLAALSLGYHLGGRRAAANASTRRLSWLLLVPAAYVAGLVLVHDALLLSLATLPLPSRFASLPAAIVLFGPPTYLLGYISPYAAELSAETGTGAASGHVYAVGTVGSIIGAFGTTFVLVPWLGIEAIGAVLGGLLVAAAIWLARSPLRLRPVGAALLVGVVLVAAVSTGTLGVSAGGEVVYGTQTAYQELRVTDLGGVRTLYLDGARHSAMDLDDPDRHVFTYTRSFHLPLLATDDVDRVLFIGGGGFTGPKRFLSEYPDVEVDVVELDPEVVRVAREYFRVPDSPRLDVHVGDGREFLRSTEERYDVIVLDAYRKDKVPFHLATVEFMRLARDRLTSDGVLVANVISAPEGPAAAFYRAEYKTMRAAFPRVYAFPTVGGSVVQNVMLLATRDDAVLTEAELQRRNERRDIGIDLEDEIAAYRVEDDLRDAPLLTDDRAPVDRLLDASVGQRYVIEESTPARTPA